jgi:hypothetical protein
MGHLGVTEVVLVLGLLGLIFAERIVRVFTRWVGKTRSPSLGTGQEPALSAEKAPEQPADAGS